LVAGLRRVCQTAQVELDERPERDARLYALAVVCTLADVAQAFGLSDNELVEIVGEQAASDLKRDK
jgi:hypothetical protein